jgi:hypothetical protein
MEQEPKEKPTERPQGPASEELGEADMEQLSGGLKADILALGGRSKDKDVPIDGLRSP